MAITLPANFKKDIQGKDTALIPLVSISIPTGTADDINISTVSIHVPHRANYTNTDLGNFIPLLLNIPSLKESIDIEKRNYKISSITLDISNYPYDGLKFSDRVSDHSLINLNVDIMWYSPNSTYYATGDYWDDYLGDANMVFRAYRGFIRRYDHDDEKVRIVVEDQSQAALHKDLPLPNTGQQTNWLGTGDDVPNKYKNKPIPMVYGYVDKSPCVLKVEKDANGDETQTTIIAETNPVVFNSVDSGYAYEKSPIFIYENKYYPIVDNNFQLDYSTDQYSIIPNSGKVVFIHEYAGEESLPNSNISNNQLEIKIIRRPISVFAIDNPPYTQHTGGDGVMDEGDYDFVDYFSNLDNIKIIGTDSGDLAPINIAALTNAGIICDFEPTGEDYFCKTFLGLHMQAQRPSVAPDGSNASNGSIILRGSNAAGTLIEPSSNLLILDDTDIWHSIYNFAPSQIYSHSAYEFIDWNSVNIGSQVHFWAGAGIEARFNLEVKWFQVILIQHAYITNPLAKDFYANVTGRLANPTTPELLASIMDTELGFSGVDNTNDPNYANWKYAFTIDKKINSKKLFENIASASPYVPHFNNIGEFKLDIIPMGGGTSIPEEENGTIQEVDVIDYSFSRTPIEDVYTKIELKYHWDYARKEFDKELEIQYEGSSEVFNYFSTDMLISDGFLDADYTPQYYGLSGTDGNPHSDSTLIVDDDRGKYIRFEEFPAEGVRTAERFANWLLSWHCNQHLKMKIRLPLKYMNLEVGGIIKVGDNGVLGGVKPYGIDYTMVNERVNGQLAYNRFMIFKTNKTLEYCEIECIQLHQLTDGIEGLVGDIECPGGYYDCKNDCGGQAFEDFCGNCVYELDYDICSYECYGVYNGTAITDCLCVCGGSAVVNECGDCGDVGTGMVEDDYGNECCDDLLATDCLYDFDTECCVSICGGCGETDCAGVPNGSSIICWDGSCADSEADCPDPEAGLHPISIPGSDVAAVADDLIVLNGGDSLDIDGFIAEYIWYFDDFLTDQYGNPFESLQATNIFNEGFGDGDLSEEVQWLNFSFRAPDISDPYFVNCEGAYPYFCIFDINLRVTDNDGNYGHNKLFLTVYNEMDAPAVRADAGSDQVFLRDFEDFTPDDKIYLDGSNSYTTIPDGYIIAWEWTQIGGTPVDILPDHEYDADGLESNWFPGGTLPYFIAPPPGEAVWGEYWNYEELTFRLAVFDNEFNEGQNEVTITILPCPFVGDMNFDGWWNVLDIVILANCVLANNCPDLEYGCAGDMNLDGSHNILDIVSLVHCILEGNCNG